MAKFWSFVKNEANPEEVELRIEGEIIDDDYAWFYEWFGLNHISPNEFRAELQEHAGKNLIVWIDSWGGDVTAAAGIYNALKEHKGKVTVKIDGKAVSAASVIAMAGDEVLMSPVGIMMIHNPWTGVVGEAKDMRHMADVLDEIKDTIINAYQLKTGRSRAKISKMMDEETWMSANKALSEGFIDGMLYTDSSESGPVENSFMFSRMAIQNKVSESMKRIIEQYNKLGIAGASGTGFNIPKTQESAAQVPQPVNQNREDDGAVEIKTVDELRQHFSDLVNQVEAAAREEGAKNERERIKAIDEIAQTVAPELVNKAKYEEPMTAEKLAYEALKDDAAKGRQYLDNVTRDNKESGVNNVGAQPQNQQSTKEIEDEKREAIANSIAEFAAKRRNK